MNQVIKNARQALKKHALTYKSVRTGNFGSPFWSGIKSHNFQ